MTEEVAEWRSDRSGQEEGWNGPYREVPRGRGRRQAKHEGRQARRPRSSENSELERQWRLWEEFVESWGPAQGLGFNFSCKWQESWSWEGQWSERSFLMEATPFIPTTGALKEIERLFRNAILRPRMAGQGWFCSFFFPLPLQKVISMEI